MVIGIDLGGTKCASALFSQKGRAFHKGVVRLGGRRGREVGRLIGEEVRRLMSLAQRDGFAVKAVGVSVPGIAEAKSGRVWAPNIPGWRRYPLRREIQSVLRVACSAAGGAGRGRTLEGASRIPVLIDSDRACSILGEAWQGAAKGCRDAIFLAVGTGIGAGILSEGRVLRGAHDIAGSVGWMALDRPFRPEYASCGCFEHHASGEGIAKAAKELKKRSNDSTIQGFRGVAASDVFEGYARGDALATKVLAQAIEFWGMAVANLVTLFNPERIVFGGGIFGPATQFLGNIHAEAKKWAQPVAMKRAKLLASKLGGDAAVYGAGFLALQARRTTSG